MSKWIDVKVALPAMTRTAVVCDDGEKWIGYYSISSWFKAEIIHSYKCLRWRPLTAAEIIAGKVLPDEPDPSPLDALEKPTVAPDDRAVGLADQVQALRGRLAILETINGIPLHKKIDSIEDWIYESNEKIANRLGALEKPAVVPVASDAPNDKPIAQFGNYTVKHSKPFEVMKYVVLKPGNREEYFFDFPSARDAAKEYDYRDLCAAREKEGK